MWTGSTESEWTAAKELDTYRALYLSLVEVSPRVLMPTEPDECNAATNMLREHDAIDMGVLVREKWGETNTSKIHKPPRSF